MNGSTRQLLLERLKDERSKRVIFVSHCLLNENTRYLGGAFQRGGVDEIVDGFQQEGLGCSTLLCHHPSGGNERRHWDAAMIAAIFAGVVSSLDKTLPG